MAKPVPGLQLLQAAVGQANLAQQTAMAGNSTQSLAHLATAVQQLAAGVKDALQAIYTEVD